MTKKEMRRKPDNPRQISQAEYARLQADLVRFGDLSGVVHNVRTGNLACGNQRFSALDLAALEPVITERYAEPTRTGTLAEGYFIQHGERFTYRQVDWDLETENHACVAANRDGGRWDWAGELLLNTDAELLGDWGFDEEYLHELNDDAANTREFLEAQAEPAEFPEYDESIADDVEMMECPQCGHRFPK